DQRQFRTRSTQRKTRLALEQKPDARSLPHRAGFRVVQTVHVVYGCCRLRKLTEDRDLSQEKLAELANLHRNYVGNLGRGKSNVSLLTIVRLAHCLNVRPVKLIEVVR